MCYCGEVTKIRERLAARLLRTRGYSIKEIARKLSVSTGSVSPWVQGIPLCELARRRLEVRERRGGERGRETLRLLWREYRRAHPKPVRGPRWPSRSVETFFDTWTPDMAYVLGYFAADGSMYENNRGSRYVAFTSTDGELIETVKCLLGVANDIEVYERGEKYKTRYTLQIGSKKLYRRLLELGLSPAKSLTLKLPNVPDAFLGHFVRGYFDGDGYAYAGLQYRSNRSQPLKVLTFRLVSGSRSFLHKLKGRIAQVTGISDGALISHGRNAYVLAYAGKATRLLYKFLYPIDAVPCLLRKKSILDENILGARSSAR